MTLPPAKKEVSEHPAKDAVTAPVNKALKDQDVGRKIRLYGAIEALRKGRLPTNKQTDEGLCYIRDNSPFDVDQLSPEGRKLIDDMREIINTTRLIIQEKNADELLQNFIWHTRDIDYRETITGEGGVTEGLPTLNRESAEDNEEAARHLRTLFHIVLTNSEARKLLSDFSVIGRDLLSKSAARVAETLAPTEEALRRVDEAGPPDQFISEGGRRVGPEETPVLEAGVPGTEATVRRHPRDDEAFIHTGGEDGERRMAASDVREEGVSRAMDVAGEGARAGEEVKESTRGHVEDVRSSEEPAQAAQAKRTGLMGKLKGVTDDLTGRVPSQHRDRANEQYEQGRSYLAEEYFPEERREQFIFRGKKVVLECQKHEDYQKSIRWLLDYISHYAQHGRQQVAETAEAGPLGALSDSKLNLSIREVRTLLERFANNTSLDGVVDAANVLIEDSKSDPELRHWFKNADTYIRRILLEPGYVLEDRCNEDGKELRETGRRFYDDKYRTEFDDLFQNVSAWFNAMGEDPLNKQFGEDLARLTKDLLFDSEGALKFKPELWNDIRKVILPQIIEKVGYIPIPRIEYTDDSLDLVVENLALQGRNLFPNIISLEANNFVRFSPYNAIQDSNKHHITLSLEQMQCDMRDVAFYYRMKKGAGPLKMSDSGLADVLVGGKGVNSTISLRSSPSHDKTSVFKVDSVHVKVESLKFSIRDSKHDFLYKTIKPLATGLVKKQIQKAIQDALKTGLEYIDGQLVSVRDRMERAKEAEKEPEEGRKGETRAEVLKSLFQSKKEDAEGHEKEKEKREKHFKVVANKRDSILVDQGNPKGWVNLTDERERLAENGEEWRSDAFDLVEKTRLNGPTAVGTDNSVAAGGHSGTGAISGPQPLQPQRTQRNAEGLPPPSTSAGVVNGQAPRHGAEVLGQGHTHGHPGHAQPEHDERKEHREAAIMLGQGSAKERERERLESERGKAGRERAGDN